MPDFTHATQDDTRFDDRLGGHWLFVHKHPWPRGDTRLLVKPHVPSILSVLGKDVALDIFSSKHSLSFGVCCLSARCISCGGQVEWFERGWMETGGVGPTRYSNYLKK